MIADFPFHHVSNEKVQYIMYPEVNPISITLTDSALVNAWKICYSSDTVVEAHYRS